jgi:DNA-binding transcriptional LysR family regulator
MNLNQLKIFYTLAREKSFSLAAKRLLLTQPAVTIQIHLLEDHFGVRLVERSGRNIELTEAGKVLYSYAEQILNMASEVENVLGDFRSLDKGLLKIDTSRTIAKYYIPKILPLFRERYPNIKINLRAGNSQEAVDWVLNFTSDIAIVARIDYPDKLAVIPVFEDELVLIASPNSGLFRMGETEFRELDGKPLIIREEGSAIRSLLLKEFEKEGIKPNIVMELGNSDAIKELVNQGIGLSILTWPMISDEIKRGRLRTVRLTDKKLTINVDIIFHRSRESSRLIQVFKDLVLEVLSRIKSNFQN